MSRAQTWDNSYTTGRFRDDWHLDLPSPELCALLSTGAVSSGRVLDVGCGGGTEAVYLAGRGFDVTALDIAPSAIEMVRSKAARAGVSVRVVVADATRTGLPDGSFDLVTDRSCFHASEPKQWAAYVDEIARILAPGGRLFIRGFGGTKLRPDLAEFERLFSPRFDLGPVQDLPRQPFRHAPARIGLLTKLPAA